MTNPGVEVGVVVVNFEDRDRLLGCLACCRRHAADAFLLVVDNASGDGSAGAVREHFPGVHLVAQAQNLGFAAGANAGIRVCLERGLAYILVLNSDIELSAGAVASLAAFMDGTPHAGAVQPAILLPDGRVNSMGNPFHFLGFCHAGGHGLTVSEAEARLPWLRRAGRGRAAEVPSCSGAAILLRAEALRDVGLLADELFLYCEDLELSLRLRRAGWTTWVLPEATAVHDYKFSGSKEKWFYLERNRLYVWSRLWRRRTLLLLLPAMLVSEVAVNVLAAYQGWLGHKLRSYRALAALVRRRPPRRAPRPGLPSDRQLMASASGGMDSGEFRHPLVVLVLNPAGELAWRCLYLLLRW